jgi:HSP20 family protein
LQREIDRPFDNFAQSFGRFPGYGSGELVPSMNVRETDAEVEFTAEEKDVEMTLADNVLTIRGEKKAEKEEKKKDYRLVERSFGSVLALLRSPPRASALRQSRQRLTRVC